MGRRSTAQRRLGRWLGLCATAALPAILSGSAPATPSRAVDIASPAVRGLAPHPGLTLRRALEAIDAGDSERADALLEMLAKHHPVVADYADLTRLRLRVDAGRDDEAIALGSSWAHPESPLAADFLRLVGLAHANRGEEAEARRAWKLAIRRA